MRERGKRVLDGTLPVEMMSSNGADFIADQSIRNVGFSQVLPSGYSAHIHYKSHIY